MRIRYTFPSHDQLFNNFNIEIEIIANGQTGGTSLFFGGGNSISDTQLSVGKYFFTGQGGGSDNRLYITGRSGGGTLSIDNVKVYEAIPDATKSRIRTDDSTDELNSANRASWFPNAEATIVFKGAYNASGTTNNRILRIQDAANTRRLELRRSGTGSAIQWVMDSDTASSQNGATDSGQFDGTVHTYIFTFASDGTITYYRDAGIVTGKL